jgi:hypothetical protein
MITENKWKIQFAYGPLLLVNGCRLTELHSIPKTAKGQCRALNGYLQTLVGLRLFSVTLTIDIESNGAGDREER